MTTRKTSSEIVCNSDHYNVKISQFHLACLFACCTLFAFATGWRWAGYLSAEKWSKIRIADHTKDLVKWELGTLRNPEVTFEILSDGKLKPSDENNGDGDDDDDDEIDLDVGRNAQQVLVDLHNVDGYFLSSKVRLTQAAKDFFLSRSKHTKQLFHHVCNKMGIGWDCTVLLESGSRISIVTWPLAGVMALDVYWQEEHAVEGDLTMIERFFAHPCQRHAHGVRPPPPYMQWALKSRDHMETLTNVEKADLSYYLTGSLWQHPRKKHIASVQTAFQRIDIYELWRRAVSWTYDYHEAFANRLSDPHQALHPDRMVFLDGVIQSRLFGEAAYHEALVHPALFAHPYPRRVAIIGGGEGATLREVLKHRSVEKVTMIDIDYEMVMVSREYLPEWCDCSNLVGSASWCSDDPRAELFYEDAIQWFISRYGDGRNELEPYDVIIMDALDPDSAVPFSDTLYDNAQFVEALSTALNPDGIMIMQTGAGSDDEELPIEYSKGKNYERLMINHMRNNGFVDHKNYEESSTRFMGVWGFSILFKNWETRNRWFSSSASIDLELRKRATSTKNGESPFRFFDGASMMLYQDSSRFDEERMCLQNEIDDVFCRYARGFDEGNENIPSASLSALVDDHSKVSIITRQDIPEGAFVALESGVDAWEISSQTLQFLETTSQGMPTERFKTNIEQLGSPTCLRGGKTLFVDTDIFGLLRQEDYGAQSFNIGLNDTDLKHLLQCPFDIFAIEDRDAYARRVRFQHSATAFIPAGSMLQPFRFY